MIAERRALSTLHSAVDEAAVEFIAVSFSRRQRISAGAEILATWCSRAQRPHAAKCTYGHSPHAAYKMLHMLYGQFIR